MKISIGKEKLRAKLPWRVTNNTTTNLGFVQPLMMLHTVANGDYKINMQTQVRLSPLVAPTFAHMYLKTYARAIQITDIWKPFSNLYSGKPYKFSEGNSMQVITNSPRASLLSIFFNLIGCYDNFSYCPYESVTFDANGRVRSSVKWTKFTQTNQTVKQQFKNMVAAVDAWNTDHPSNLAPYDNLLLCSLMYGFYWHQNHLSESREFFNYDREFNERINIQDSFDAEGADFIFCVRDRIADSDLSRASSGYFHNTTDTDNYSERAFVATECVGIRLGEFGKKLRQVFRGLGIPIDDMLNPCNIYHHVANGERMDLTDLALFNVLPLVAYCKVIYDQYGIRKFVDYNSTAIYNLINHWNNKYIPENIFTYHVDTSSGCDAEGSAENVNEQTNDLHNSYAPSYVGLILLELMRTSWYTLDVDLFSSINKTVGIQNNSEDIKFSDFVTYFNSEATSIVQSNSKETNYYEDSDAEKSYPIAVNIANKLLHWVNTENVIGASIAKWFKDKYGINLETDQTTYSTLLGHSSTDINIGPIFSNSDTENADDTQGQTLGAYAGHGEARDKVNNLSNYHSKDFGFIFAFGCVCPEVGYFQSLEPIYQKNERFDYFTPEWDSMGYVPISQNIINAGFLNNVAGVLPRYFVDKFKFSVVNGDMNLPSTRNNMEAYWFNREVSPNFADQTGLLLSDDFRRVGKIESLGFYNKIFTETSPFVDHYLIDAVFDIKASLPCKPIMDSWDTIDEQDGQGRSVTSKA